MIAFDADDGENGRITYSIVSTEEVGDRKRRSTDDVTDRFKIHPHRGVIWSQKEFVAGEVFDLVVSVKAYFQKLHYRKHSTVQHLKPATYVAHVQYVKFIDLYERDMCKFRCKHPTTVARFSATIQLM